MTTALLLPQHIQLNASPENRQAAIGLIAERMTACGLALPEYADSLWLRETVTSTELGHGVAVPHGMPQHRHWVQRTGVVVLQMPAGVDWGAGKVHLAFGIAARSDAHLPLLRQLTRLLNDPARLAPLFTTSDVGTFCTLLNDAPPATAQPVLDDLPHRFHWRVDYPNGLHARPANAWVETTRRFDAVIRARLGSASADGRQLLALLQLGARQGDLLAISADGPQAEQALRALRATLQRQSALESAPFLACAALGNEDDGATIAGIPACPGTVSAPTWRLPTCAGGIDAPFTSLLEEGRRLEQALGQARQALSLLIARSADRLGESAAAILQVQRTMLEDPALITAACRHMAQGHSAAWSWRVSIEDQASVLAASNQPAVRAKAADVRDMGRRVLEALGAPSAHDWAAALPADSIIIADDILPSQMAQLSPGRILGLCLAGSGPQAHSAILARALALPCMVAGGDALLAVPDGTPALLDGTRGSLILHPAARPQMETRLAGPPPKDVTLLANADTPEQWRRAAALGAQGVGLMRSETLLLGQQQWLDEETQYQAFRAMIEALEGRPLVIRALDLGGDKAWPALTHSEEHNPALGLRGARWLLAHPERLQPHLRALYRAASHGPFSLMFPMITAVDEMLALRAICETVRDTLRAPTLPIGAMIEVPAAALLVDRLAPHADFMSIGSNDLTQYVLAMDRQHPLFAGHADARHPSVLRLIAQASRAAQARGCPLSVCGALAGQPGGARLLYGLGVRTLSIAAAELALASAELGDQDAEAMTALADQALQADTLAAVRALVREDG